MHSVARKDGVELGKVNLELLIKSLSIQNQLLMLTVLCTYKLIIIVVFKQKKKKRLYHSTSLFAQTQIFPF